MDDFDLEALQAQLSQAQDAKSTVRLAERNVVDLILKIKDLGMFAEPLLYTLSGREYLTESQLEREIKAAVDRQHGCVALVDLPMLLEVDLVHCERIASKIVRESKTELLQVEGDMISQVYFDEMAVEINDLLQQSGCMSVTDLAKRYNLSLEMIQQEAKARLGSKIQGKMDTGLIYTDAYINRVKVQLRGALRAASSPVNVKALTKKLRLAGASGSLIGGLIEELANSGSVKGDVKNSGMMFTPHVYSAMQNELIKSTFRQNGYITFASLKEQGIPRPEKFFHGLVPDAQPLDSVSIGDEILLQTDATLENTLADGTWCDVKAVLPADFNTQDCCKVLAKSSVAKSAAKTKAAFVMAETGFVTAAFLERCEKVLVEHAQGDAAAQLEQKHASTSAVSVKALERVEGAQRAEAPDSDDDWDMGSKKKKGKKGKGGGKKPPGPAPVAADDDWDTGGKKGKKGKKGKGGKGANQNQKGAAKENQQASAAPSPPGTGELLNVLLEAFPELQDVGETESLAAAIVDRGRPAAWAAFESALKAAFTRGAEKRRKRLAELTPLLSASYKRFLLYSKGLPLFENEDDEDGALLSTMSRHLLRSNGLEAADLLVRSAAWAEIISGSDAVSEDNPALEAAGPIPDAERNNLAKVLGGKAMAVVETAVKGKNADSFAAALEEAARECCDIKLVKLDKKEEKRLLEDYQVQLSEQFGACQDPTVLLSLLAPLLFFKVHNVAVTIPGKGLAGALGRLEGKLSEHAFETVMAYHKLVVAKIKESTPEVLAALEEQVPAIKDLVAAEDPYV